MNTNSTQKKYGFIAVGFIVIALCVFKIPFLHLPFYWDESWVYSRAVYAMADAGPSLMPGSIDADLYTGHPLMFYFLSSLWINLFGHEIFTAHLFPLFISCTLLLVIYLLVLEISDVVTAVACSALLAVQPITLGQSGFLYSEVLITLFVFLSMLFYVKKRYFLFVVALSCVLLTKESGYAFWGAITSFVLGYDLVSRRKLDRQLLKKTLLFLIPLAVGLTFFIVQKIKLGWFFFPRHAGWIESDPGIIFSKLKYISKFVFLEQSRVLLVVAVATAAALFFLGRRKLQLAAKTKNILLLMLSVLVCWILFCSINFYTHRYTYCAIAVYIVFVVVALRHFIPNKKIFAVACSAIFLVNAYQIPSSFTSGGEVTMGYAGQVITHQQMTQYCEQNNLYDSIISTHFLMYMQMTYKACGYLKDRQFQITNVIHPDSKYFIFSTVEFENNLSKIREDFDLRLIKRFEKYGSWCELYKATSRRKQSN